MLFFNWQEAARRKTRLLLVLMVLAVIFLSALTVLMLALFEELQRHQGIDALLISPSLLLTHFTPEQFARVFMGVALVVGVGSAYRIASLSEGGYRIAESLGGRAVRADTDDFYERRLLNVVEEMALASGCSVPGVFVLDNEHGINAFAAGHDLDDAVIAVTRGTLEQLGRDELEGVIAHEFSHIVHGDMRLNIRLMGVVFGITMLAQLGRILLQFGNGARHNLDRNKKDAAPFALFGLGLMLVGFIGGLLASAIRAAISRTREYLADASAVQYTRNTEGIANALKRIGGYELSSHLINPRAAEVSHMLFGAGSLFSMLDLFSSHPTLDERIKRLEPGWKGGYLPERTQLERMTEQMQSRARPQAGSSLHASLAATAAMLASRDLAQPLVAEQQRKTSDTMATMGNPTAAQHNFARTWLQRLPAPLYQAAHASQQAPLLLLAMLLPADETESQRLIGQLAIPLGDRNDLQQLHAGLVRLADSDRLALAEIALPTLRDSTPNLRQHLLTQVHTLVMADGKVSLFEWALTLMVQHQVDQLDKRRTISSSHRQISQTRDDIHTLLATLCHFSAMHSDDQQAAYNQALQLMRLPPQPLPARASLEQLQGAIRHCGRLLPLAKQKLLQACCQCIEFDGRVNQQEAQALRIIALLCGCPIPPLIYDAVDQQDIRYQPTDG
ncbi:hypothetical protein WH50_09600 [Pokkaliibacter plantistimulans]|uniref:Peptidase M48 domain-containing protein n=1 Tax=Pokkaliibacter plantistimulans TaxID=1635171 RepID=A0ABX5LYZ8_9GAMM|nr:M48 family metallopeptidase [Pokkaliibacter plantistimulans]PXF31442.1 hypothetical protein WH50_09600 [Pokkaliibacter plantistimulans]